MCHRDRRGLYGHDFPSTCACFFTYITQTLIRKISACLASLAHLLFQQGTKSILRGGWTSKANRRMCEWAPCSVGAPLLCAQENKSPPWQGAQPYAAKHNQDRWWWGHGDDLKTAWWLSNPERLLPIRADKCASQHENTLWSDSGESDTDFSAGVNHGAVEHVKSKSTEAEFDWDKAIMAVVDFGHVLSGNKQSFSWLVLYL